MAIETVIVSEFGNRPAGNGTIYFFKDLNGRTFESWDADKIGNISIGEQVIVSYEVQERQYVGRDGQPRTARSNKVAQVTSMAAPPGQTASLPAQDMPAPQVPLALQVPMQGGDSAAPITSTNAAPITSTKDQQIMRQVAGKCACELAASLYAGQGTPGAEVLVTVQRFASVLYGYFETGSWTHEADDIPF